ncbi:uncharacterized protein LOC109140255 isoform X1 [Larimichthys crocea]|uniref:uncharacterized protein LOC109140255 isoform X1 n=1 Tax=Larimichthys crocea TaxID=215358 RepID=UPI000F5FB6B1|nr:uncharacterized protein LOC109140255 isoform X1 [Larimichthys crocea]
MENPTFKTASNRTLLLTAAQALGQASYRAKKPEEADATSNCWGPHKGRMTLQQSSGYCLLTVLSCCLSPGVQLSLQGSRSGSARCCLPGTAVGGLGSPASSISGVTPHKPGRSTTSLPRPRPLLCTSAVPVASAFVHRVLDKGCTGPSGGSWTSTAGVSWPLSTWSAVDVRRRSAGGHRASLGSCLPPTAANSPLYSRTSCPVT